MRFSHIAIPTQYLECSWISLFNYQRQHPIPASGIRSKHFSALLISPKMNMVNGKKSRFSFTTAVTFIPIKSKDIPLSLCSIASSVLIKLLSVSQKVFVMQPCPSFPLLFSKIRTVMRGLFLATLAKDFAFYGRSVTTVHA